MRQIDRINKHYNALHKQFGDDVRSLEWGCENSQSMRFNVFVETIDFQKRTVLDVGCGFGDLYAFLRRKNVHCDYLGIDINEGFIKTSKKKYPKAMFLNRVINDINGRFDVVIASGIFSSYVSPVFYKKMIPEMFEKTKYALAFNMLNNYSTKKLKYQNYYDSLEVLKYCKQFTNWVILRGDYKFNDFTIFMYKNSTK